MNGDAVDRPVLEPWVAYVHGCALVMLDGLGLGAGLSERATATARRLSFQYLLAQAPLDQQEVLLRITVNHRSDTGALVHTTPPEITPSPDTGTLHYDLFSVQTGPHYVAAGAAEELVHMEEDGEEEEEGEGEEEEGAETAASTGKSSNYALHAPTPSQNLTRVMRALQLPKPILLEGK